MRLFARVEVVLDDARDSDEQPNIERLVSDGVDLALWLRGIVDTLDQEHGSAWEADLHLEPLTDREDS